MSTPYGYDRRNDAGATGAVARWWLRRRTDRVAAALDEAKRAAEERRSRRGWDEPPGLRVPEPSGAEPSDRAEDRMEDDEEGPGGAAREA